MDLDFLWSYQTAWITKLLVVMLIAQMLLTVWLYGKMAKSRFAAVKEGLITRDDYKVVGSEPEQAAIFTRALANQFELPVMFYAVVITGLAVGVSSWITVILAFLFVLARVAHAREMIGANEVMKRRGMFINSVRVFLLLVAELLISTLFFM